MRFYQLRNRNKILLAANNLNQSKALYLKQIGDLDKELENHWHDNVLELTIAQATHHLIKYLTNDMGEPIGSAEAITVINKALDSQEPSVLTFDAALF